MVLYKCENCSYQTKDRNKYQRHLNRKFSCKDRYPLIKSDDKSQNVPSAFQGVPNEQKVLPRCKWCQKTFSRQPNLNKHLKHGHCMVKRQWLISMDMEYQRLLKEMKNNQSKINEVGENDDNTEEDELSKNVEKCILEES